MALKEDMQRLIDEIRNVLTQGILDGEIAQDMEATYHFYVSPQGFVECEHKF